jgi:hypothetical protein
LNQLRSNGGQKTLGFHGISPTKTRISSDLNNEHGDLTGIIETGEFYRKKLGS